MKEFKLLLYCDENEWGEIFNEELYTKDDKNIVVDFQAYNLCPEDAILGRDLFDADDYIKALEKGMEIAKAGYDKISVEEVKE